MKVAWTPPIEVRLPAEAVAATVAFLDRLAASATPGDPLVQRARRLRTLLAVAAGDTGRWTRPSKKAERDDRR